ncbi:histidine phosphatase family protein [Actinomadura rubrisoli]|uniref:histidine phosphatase family protein n=1 Tax=Actinomadura rubrisoli TaxID=2530368 RepID=UPI00140496CA|nr:histidine phosphatase family protein [Actinomadura rubrisoli]
MTIFYLVQHAEKETGPGDPGLTALGRSQAARTAQWLEGAGLSAVFSSPMRRAVQTAESIAEASGVAVEVDDRIRERMNWDGSQSIEEFLADWATTVSDRDFVPASGDSSHRAAQRFRSFLAEHAEGHGSVAVCTHGGVTVDLLRTLIGDRAVPSELLYRGVPSCAITTLHDLEVVSIASTAHRP